MLTYAALRTLHVDHNELRLLEPWIGQLTALSDLALNNNRLTYFLIFFNFSFCRASVSSSTPPSLTSPSTTTG